MTTLAKHTESVEASNQSLDRISFGMKLEKTGTFMLKGLNKNSSKAEYAEIINYLYVTNKSDPLENPLMENPLKSLKDLDITLTTEELNEFIKFLGYRPANEHEVRIAMSFQTDNKNCKALVFFNEDDRSWQFIDCENGDSDSIPCRIDAEQLLRELFVDNKEDTNTYGILLIRE